MANEVLQVIDFSMHYKTEAGDVHAVDNVNFSLHKGESMGLVGESGCGKTTLAFSILRLLPDNARIIGGDIFFNNSINLAKISQEEMRHIRWERISMIFQAAMNSFNPVYKVGDQIIEALEIHGRLKTKSHAEEVVSSLFNLVGLDPQLMNQYPHEYSGGMRQRAIIAMSLACNPELIIADEPTTALDVIVQDKLLKEIANIQKELNMSMIYISHDIAVIAEICETIGVMYAGNMAELASAKTIFKEPMHPYTIGLMFSFPSIVGPKKKLFTLTGEPPDLLNPPTGCRFHPRCEYATDICKKERPEWVELKKHHFVACWHPVER